MEAVEINRSTQLLAGSEVTNVDGDVFSGTITGGNEPGRAP